MTPRAWGDAAPVERTAPQAAQTPAWEAAARRRRRALLAGILGTTAAATLLLASVSAPAAHPWLAAAHMALFALLFAWVSAGCITAVMGFVVLWRGDRYALSLRDHARQPVGRDARTALIMPICHEDVASVFSGLRATCESLLQTGAGSLFEVFVLSDSADPAVRLAEETAWAQLHGLMGEQGIAVHYRWRRRRTRKKAGNVADFCRRWGRAFRYMIVLDADSVMSGDCLLGLVRAMEARPDAGIIQAAPRACGLGTLHARAQQFAGRVAGRLFTAGMQYWQLGEAHYWGHNAIIRTEPFMRHCALARLPGSGMLSGEILSHDFVEAALMRRAGWKVWLAHDAEGSFEQQPPHLLAELQRDRRWCTGNLQNARLVTEPGLHPVHRAMLVTGAMSYLSAPLWLVYLGLGSALWLLGGNTLVAPDGHLAVRVLALWAVTLGMLTLPRLLGVAAVLLRGEAADFGGLARLLAGAVLETLFSALQAPLRMAAHTLFVVSTLSGRKLEWKSPPRDAQAVAWRGAADAFALPGAVTLALCGALQMAGGVDALVWVLPVALPLLAAIPVTVWGSRPAVGQALRAAGLMLTPEEQRLPAVLQRAQRHAALVRRPKLAPVLGLPARPRPVSAAVPVAVRPAALAQRRGPGSAPAELVA